MIPGIFLFIMSRQQLCLCLLYTSSRVDLVSIDADMAEGEILSLIKAQKYSRLPVYELSLIHI